MKKCWKKLAEKAGFCMWRNEPWRPDGAVIDWANDYDEELEKFADLVEASCRNKSTENSINRN